MREDIQQDLQSRDSEMMTMVQYILDLVQASTSSNDSLRTPCQQETNSALTEFSVQVEMFRSLRVI